MTDRSVVDFFLLTAFMYLQEQGRDEMKIGWLPQNVRKLYFKSYVITSILFNCFTTSIYF